MTRPAYTIERRVEHCHRCLRLRPCTVRTNAIRPPRVAKTALCDECAEREHRQ